MSKNRIVVSAALVFALALVPLAGCAKKETVGTGTSATNESASASSSAGSSGSVPGSQSADASGTGGGTVSSALSTLKPFKKVPEATAKSATKVTSPVTAATDLTPLTDAPAKTISGVKLGAMPDGATYNVTVSPYGFGPDSPFGSQIVVKVSAAASTMGAPKPENLTGANILAFMDPSHDGAITTGGTYTARLTFRSDGSKLIPVISGVEAKK